VIIRIGKIPQTGAKDPEPETGAPPHPELNEYFHSLFNLKLLIKNG
jgi:hypothetical protein